MNSHQRFAIYFKKKKKKIHNNTKYQPHKFGLMVPTHLNPIKICVINGKC